MKKTLLGIFFLLLCIPAMNADNIKLYTTLNNYINNVCDVPSGVELRSLDEPHQLLQNKAAYYFWTTDRSIAYNIARGVFIVECEGQLYANAQLLSYERESLSKGFVAFYFKDGKFFFECIYKKDLKAFVFSPTNKRVSVLKADDLKALLQDNEELLTSYMQLEKTATPKDLLYYMRTYFMQKDKSNKSTEKWNPDKSVMEQ